jgi:hypothetical protein
MRRIVSGLLFGLALAVAIVGPRPGPAAAAVHAGSCIPANKCCKVCDAGQACGNTCISRAKQCHKGRGCACDASEICADPQG